MTTKDIQNLASLLGFQADLSDKLWTKAFLKHSNYSIRLDFAANRIDYGKKISIGDETTSNFSQPENFVVLECVCRLLEKGYEPQHIELERKWSLGRTQKSGKADIVVSNRNGEALIIIECKTAGIEYEKEKERMKSSGGQLFSYHQQDRNAKFLCLYASCAQAESVVYENAIVHINDRPEVLALLADNPDTLAYETATNVAELHQVWKEQFNCYFAPNGIFDEEAQAYNPEFKPIKRKDLKPFTEKEGQAFFNQFAEILRHNNISDQSNAFNRILSLILCKIVDERRAPNEQTDFQIIEGKDKPEDIQDRLQRLYAQGMKEFLREEIVYFSMDDIDTVIQDFPRQYAKEQIHEMFRQQKFYSNNEFAFKEVHNQKLFLENAKALNEIIMLLQYKQFRYERSDDADFTQTKRYLGDFFELLLDAGYKQTAGQFFTPLPIARFMLSSLPLRAIAERNIAAGRTDFLPRIIDYACGSGHFLTEAIAAVQRFVETLSPETTYSERVNTNIERWKTTDWTGEFLYGVEKDYRLARTTKIACFMNGDGEANVIFGDGLENHQGSEHKFPPAFDVVVANPPFSIEAFKAHLALKNNTFTLLRHLSDTSGEIEVLFMERTAQLLSVFGVAGVIVPSSLLSGGKVYIPTRDLIFRHFEIRAIIEFGSKTFMATTSMTVALFLVKREEKWRVNAHYVAEDFIMHNKSRPLDFINTEEMLATYAEHLGFAMEDYQTFLAKKPNTEITESVWFKDYTAWFEATSEWKHVKETAQWKRASSEEREEQYTVHFYAYALRQEKEKFEIFFLLHGQKTLIVRAPADSDGEKEFLGYTFSKRRQKAGLKENRGVENDDTHQTVLYDEQNPNNPDKVDTLVRAMLSLPPALSRGNERTAHSNAPLPSVSPMLQKYARLVNLSDCVSFTREDFDKQISLAVQKQRTKPQTRWETIRLEAALQEISGATSKIPEANIKESGAIPVISQERERFISGYTDGIPAITDIPLVIFGDHSCVFKYVDMPFVRGADGVQLMKPKADLYLPRAFYYILQTLTIENAHKYERHYKYLKQMLIPRPPLDVQEQLVAEMQAIERREEEMQSKLHQHRLSIAELVSSFSETTIIKQLCRIRTDKREPSEIESGSWYLGLEHIESNTGNLAGREDARAADLQSTKNAFFKGDVLYGKLRPYLNKVYIAEFDGVCSTDILVLQSAEPLLLKHILLSKGFVEQTSRLMKGVSLPRLQVKEFLELSVNAPEKNVLRESTARLRQFENLINTAQEQLQRIAAEKTAILKKYLE
jgi:type I restriction enzyme M protein